MTIYDLKCVLYDYIRNCNDDKFRAIEFEENNFYFKKVIDSLNKCLSEQYSEIIDLEFLLDKLFGNKYDKLQECIFKCERLKMLNKTDTDLYKKIRAIVISDIVEIIDSYNEYVYKNQKYVLENDRREQNKNFALEILDCFKYGQILSGSQVNFVKNLLLKLGYDNTQIALGVERLFQHNKYNSMKNGLHYSVGERYKFIDLLSLGAEVFNVPLVENEKKLCVHSDFLVEILSDEKYYINDDEIFDYFPTVGRELRDEIELEFVFVKVLEGLRKKLDEKINLIKDLDFMMNISIKNEIANECFLLIDRYNLIRNYLDSNVYVSDNLDNFDAQKIDDKIVNNVYYLINSSGKCYFESDLDDIPYEYLDKAISLIEKFKCDRLSKKKNKVLFNKEYFSELKDDQIRIIYKRIKDNNFVIYGLLIKKENETKKSELHRIFDRIGTVSENPEEIESQISEYVQNNGRKWSR